MQGEQERESGSFVPRILFEKTTGSRQTLSHHSYTAPTTGIGGHKEGAILVVAAVGVAQARKHDRIGSSQPIQWVPQLALETPFRYPTAQRA